MVSSAVPFATCSAARFFRPHREEWGRTLCDVLSTGGHHVVRLVRNRETQTSQDVFWDPIEGTVEEEGLEGLDAVVHLKRGWRDSTRAFLAVVHLAGEPLLGLRWTEEKKKRIWSSRIEGTEHLSRALARLRRPPGVLVSAYGDGTPLTIVTGAGLIGPPWASMGTAATNP